MDGGCEPLLNNFTFAYRDIEPIFDISLTQWITNMSDPATTTEPVI
jgi:hypothetical protein